ncbi:hypothetical protein B296_00043824 [Ensete ventricosum]|uniref:Uncharacterized protein n=1 Tax=Ensete ventricosum TaxID=4639 RepID=A0A426X4U7_ENSVE|nr:hypothetical protein B296_00043824 [Ensete ventricosum]
MASQRTTSLVSINHLNIQHDPPLLALNSMRILDSQESVRLDHSTTISLVSPVATPTIPQPDAVKPVPLPFLAAVVDAAFRRRCWVSITIVAIQVLHVVPSEAPHPCSLIRRHRQCVVSAVLRPLTRRRMVDGIDGTAMEDELRKFGDIRGVFVIDLVAAAGGGPVGAVPYGGVQ